MLAGALVAMLGGVISGFYAAPSKYTRGSAWKFEHSWIVFGLVALLLIPAIVTVGTIPISDVVSIIQDVPTSGLVLPAVFGACWGLGNALFGLATTLVGTGITFSICMGISSTLGSLLPLLLQHPDEVKKRAGIFDFIGVGIAVVGIGLVGWAGQRRENLRDDLMHAAVTTLTPTHPSTNTETNAGVLRAENGESSSMRERFLSSERIAREPEEKPFIFGLIVCVLSGTLSGMFNLAMAYGDKLKNSAKDFGVSEINQPNMIFIICLPAGWVTQCAYVTASLLQKGALCTPFRRPKNRPYYRIGPHLRWNILMGASMATLWFISTWLYGFGEVLMGDLGPAIAFPIFQGITILASNLFGLATGEWRYSDLKTRVIGVLGNLTIICSVCVIAIGELDRNARI